MILHFLKEIKVFPLLISILVLVVELGILNIISDIYQSLDKFCYVSGKSVI